MKTYKKESNAISDLLIWKEWQLKSSSSYRDKYLSLLLKRNEELTLINIQLQVKVEELVND